MLLPHPKIALYAVVLLCSSFAALKILASLASPSLRRNMGHSRVSRTPLDANIHSHITTVGIHSCISCDIIDKREDYTERRANRVPSSYMIPSPEKYCIVQAFRRALKTTRELLALVQNAQRVAPSSQTDLIGIETDKLFNSTIAEVIGRINTICNATFDRKSVSHLAVATSALGTEFVLELDGESSRVNEALSLLPWWDTWTFDHWIGKSTTFRHRAYLKFFEEEGPILRSLAETASVINDNIIDLMNYCRWYTSDDTLHLIYDDADSDDKIRPVTTQTISRDIQSLINRIEITLVAGKSPEVPGWSPRRGRPPPIHRIH
ncbi:hypothetical protein C8R43DRAFT_954529 [Mycena crocata]|nr:hypothetical protein C8R43DRAFT_954529 [Mycena crocata]